MCKHEIPAHHLTLSGADFERWVNRTGHNLAAQWLRHCEKCDLPIHFGPSSNVLWKIEIASAIRALALGNSISCEF